MTKLTRSAMMISVYLLMYGAASAATTKVEIKNQQVYTTENGVKTNQGKYRKTETRNGETKIYTNKSYSKSAVTLDRRGNVVDEEDEDE